MEEKAVDSRKVLTFRRDCFPVIPTGASRIGGRLILPRTDSIESKA
ncbi:hypothetical protein [Sediminispirochaeta smaragdinae]|jgi:hypothetical protein|nr:hypothetical protein [Sediminispirochaeta smaragdinae]